MTIILTLIMSMITIITIINVIDNTSMFKLLLLVLSITIIIIIIIIIIIKVEEVSGLDGQWINTEGLRCSVSAGKCSFGLLDPEQSKHDIAVKDGALTLNGWQAVWIRERNISWRKKGKTLEWSRV